MEPIRHPEFFDADPLERTYLDVQIPRRMRPDRRPSERIPAGGVKSDQSRVIEVAARILGVVHIHAGLGINKLAGHGSPRDWRRAERGPGVYRIAADAIE